MAVVGDGIREKIAVALGVTSVTSFICDVEGSPISDGETVTLTPSGFEVTMGSQLYEITETEYPVEARRLNIGTIGGINSYVIAFSQDNAFTYTLPFGRYNVTSLTITVQG